MPQPQSKRVMWWIACFAAAVTAVAWCAHFAAPTDMFDHDQLKPAGYTLDIVQNGAWAAQTDLEALPASKPPLFPWLAASLSLVTGRVSDFELYLPSGLCLLLAALSTTLVCARYVGRTAALWTALAFIFNPLITKHLCLARADATFTGMIALAGWSLAMSVIAREKGDRSGAARWILAFWVGATLATLAKGPLGVLLALSGAACVWWPRRWERGAARPVFNPTPWWAHAVGAAFLLVVAGGWLAWAIREGGQPVIDRMIGRELIGHTLGTHSSPPPFSRPYLSTLYFLARFLPWTPLVGLAMVRVVVRPSSDVVVRIVERFAWMWVVLGLAMLSIPGHQRGDLLLPLWPAAALLAGQQVARLIDRYAVSPRRNYTGVIATIAIGTAAVWWFNGVANIKKPEVVASIAAQKLAERIGKIRGDLPLSFDRTAWDLQWDFRTKQALADGPEQTARPCLFFTRRPLAGQTPIDTGHTSWGDGKGDVFVYRLD